MSAVRFEDLRSGAGFYLSDPKGRKIGECLNFKLINKFSVRGKPVDACYENIYNKNLPHFYEWGTSYPNYMCKEVEE